MKSRSSSLYLLTGIALGILLGLIYAWSIRPAEAVDTNPASLQTQYKDQYRALIALAFASGGDLVRARARLSVLGDNNPYASVQEQTQRMAVNGETGEVTALRLLGAALAQNPLTP